MLKIGSDLDGCVFNTVPEYIKVGNRLLGTFHTLDDLKDYELKTLPGWTEEAAQTAITAVLASGDYPLIENASILERIRNFVTIKYELFFGTARRDIFFKDTKDQLGMIFGQPFQIANGLGSKWRFIKEAKLDFFVEDCWEEAANIALRTACITFLIDYPYNQPQFLLFTWAEDRIIRVKGWDDILHYFKGTPRGLLNEDDHIPTASYSI